MQSVHSKEFVERSIEQHPAYLSDEFIANLIKYYERKEGDSSYVSHRITLGSECLSMELLHDSQYEFEVAIFNRSRLMIRRVSFRNRRNGVFTHMIAMLLDALKDTPVVDVEVESVLTPEMCAWCKKYNFSEIPGMYYSPEGLGGSYRIDVQLLRKIINCKP